MLLSRNQRRKLDRAKKPFRSRNGDRSRENDAFQIINAIKTLREKGALHINYDTYQVSVVSKSLFSWDSRTEEWKNGFLSRFHAYLDAMTGKDPDAKTYIPLQLTLTDQASGDILDTFKPNSKDE